MLNTAIIAEIAALKNVSVEEVKNAKIEGSDWGSCEIGSSIFMFDLTKAGKLRKYSTKPSVRYFCSIKDQQNCIN